jgi:glutamate/tyrosine decarboxylase-like PLP-dependent enzyme
LSLSAEEARRLGHRVVDLLVEHMTGAREEPAAGRATRAEMEGRLREPPPEGPSDPLAVLDQAMRDVIEPRLHIDHPRFFAYVPLPSNPVGVAADALAAGLGVFAGTWLAAPGAAQVELLVLDWLTELLGLPESTEGLLVSGGSVANLTALAVARDARLGDDRSAAVAYVSKETHSSIARALRVLGFSADQIRVLEADRAQRLDPAAVEAAVAGDRAAGRRPWCVVATAGTINTGAVDPLPALRDVCDRHGMWLHVDGAFGAAAAITPRGRATLEGLANADSLVIDPHKWLFQPAEIGCVLIRERGLLEATFATHASYLEDALPREQEVNFADRGIQLTRAFRALKLWMSMKTFGVRAFREAVEHGLALAERAEALLDAHPAWEVVTPATLGIVTFRLAAHGRTPAEVDAATRALVEAAIADAFTVVSSTTLADRPVLRLCPINPRSTVADVAAALDRLAELATGD